MVNNLAVKEVIQRLFAVSLEQNSSKSILSPTYSTLRLVTVLGQEISLIKFTQVVNFSGLEQCLARHGFQ